MEPLALRGILFVGQGRYVSFQRQEEGTQEGSSEWEN